MPVRCSIVLLAIAGCSGSSGPTAPAAIASPGAPAAPSRADALAAWTKISRVVTHPRCVNCHPPDDTPRQGMHSVVHDPPVIRGVEDRGAVALGCRTCHQDANAELARIPGAPSWHLAPIGMAWLGRTPAQICAQIKDPARNGGRTLAQIEDHVAHDRLVAWAWTPGADREPAPGTQAELGALFQTWIDGGTACPDDDATAKEPR